MRKWGLIPGRDTRFFFLPKYQDWLGHNQCSVQWMFRVMQPVKITTHFPLDPSARICNSGPLCVRESQKQGCFFGVESVWVEKSKKVGCWFQASATKQMRTALFWVIVQWVVVITTTRFKIIQNSAVLIYVAAEAWSQSGVKVSFFLLKKNVTRIITNTQCTEKNMLILLLWLFCTFKINIWVHCSYFWF